MRIPGRWPIDVASSVNPPLPLAVSGTCTTLITVNTVGLRTQSFPGGIQEMGKCRYWMTGPQTRTTVAVAHLPVRKVDAKILPKLTKSRVLNVSKCKFIGRLHTRYQISLHNIIRQIEPSKQQSSQYYCELPLVPKALKFGGAYTPTCSKNAITMAYNSASYFTALG